MSITWYFDLLSRFWYLGDLPCYLFHLYLNPIRLRGVLCFRVRVWRSLFLTSEPEMVLLFETKRFLRKFLLLFCLVSDPLS